MTKKKLLKEISSIMKNLKLFNLHIDYDEKDGRYYLTDKQWKIAQKTFDLLRDMSFFLKLQDVKDFKFKKIKTIDKPLGHDIGSLVKVRPCGKEYENKTFIGFLIGDVALTPTAKIEKSTIVVGVSNYNPAIFIPELKKIVYGYESWWQEIESEEDFKEITNSDIESQWYMKVLENMKVRKVEK